MAEMTWHQAIQHVLTERGEPLHVQEITDLILENGLRDSYGATPSATVGALLAQSVRHDPESPYVRVRKATFALRASHAATNQDLVRSPPTDNGPISENEVEDAGLVYAFGMFWRRDAVHWTNSVSLRGRQRLEASTVDFAGQFGVYLLHDGREVVYVGRSVDRPLGLRLFEHTKDRLQTRWDRFSWFGLRRVTEEGELVDSQAQLSTELVAVTLEAVLIEGLEPRQNRKRGDGFNATEYLQAEDPEIERRKHLQFIDSLKSKF